MGNGSSSYSKIQTQFPQYFRGNPHGHHIQILSPEKILAKICMPCADVMCGNTVRFNFFPVFRFNDVLEHFLYEFGSVFLFKAVHCFMCYQSSSLNLLQPQWLLVCIGDMSDLYMGPWGFIDPIWGAF